MNFIHAYHETPYGFDLNHVSEMMRIDQSRTMEGVPKAKPIIHMSTFQVQEMQRKKHEASILAMDSGANDFGMGNLVKKNIKFGIKNAFQTPEDIKLQFANPNQRKDKSDEMDANIDPIAMCIKNLNKSSSLYVEERLDENKILDKEDFDAKTKIMVMEVQADIKLKEAIDKKKKDDKAKLAANVTY